MEKISFSTKQSHQQLIRSLYRQHKAANSKFSLAYICLRSGIPSKGYLGDVMKGKRRLNLKYATRLGRTLSLSGPQLKSFTLMVKRDHECDPKRRDEIEKNLAVIRTSVQANADMRLISKVFSGAGLVRGFITARKLATLLIDISETEIGQCLLHLVDMGALIESKKGYTLTQSQFVFQSAKNSEVLERFFQNSISEAARAVSKWFSREDESFFQSTIISVKKSVYIKELPRIKEFFDGLQSNIESSEADSIVYFNIQIYPENRSQ